MKDIDWSKAPEGTTHAGIDGCDDIQWYKDVLPNGGYHYWARQRWYKEYGRPVTRWVTPRPTQWQGPQDGLPPVGYTQDDCAMVNLDESDKFTVVAHHYGHAIVAFGPGPKEGTVMSTAAKVDEFRPIQSELDKLLNYAHNLVDKKLINSNASADGSFSLESIIEVLFDAGMLVDPERKPAGKMTHGEAWRALNDVLNDRRISMAMGSRDMIIEALAKGVEL